MGLGVHSTGMPAPGLKVNSGRGAGLDGRRIWPFPDVLSDTSSLSLPVSIGACEGAPGLKVKDGNGADAVGCRECLRAWREGPLGDNDSIFAAGLKDREAMAM